MQAIDALLNEICRALAELSELFPDHEFIYPVHLNPNVQGPVYERLGQRKSVRLMAPLPYRPFVALMRACRLVLTDDTAYRRMSEAVNPYGDGHASERIVAAVNRVLHA